MKGLHAWGKNIRKIRDHNYEVWIKQNIELIWVFSQTVQPSDLEMICRLCFPLMTQIVRYLSLYQITEVRCEFTCMHTI